MSEDWDACDHAAAQCSANHGTALNRSVWQAPWQMLWHATAAGVAAHMRPLAA